MLSKALSYMNVLCWILLFRAAKSEDDFYSLTAEDINGKQVQFSHYEGKVVLVVNVASQCGFTEGHYRALKRLHDILRFKNKFEILAFPCNQFGNQEPGEPTEIRDVAFKQYGVSFTVFQKVEVLGSNISPVWKYLTDNSGVVPQWNFYKYLLDHHGSIIQVWPPQTPVEDIFEVVQRAVHDAEEEVQLESPLGSHDEL